MKDDPVIYQGGNAVGRATRALTQAVDGEDMQLITLNDVSMVEKEFSMEGPFDVRVRDQLFGPCTVTNFKRLRPGYTYDRVLLEGSFKRQVRVEESKDKGQESQAKK